MREATRNEHGAAPGAGLRAVPSGTEASLRLAPVCAKAAGFFRDRGYLRVATPHWQPIPPSSTGIEAGARGPWRRPSPEYHLKGLLAAGTGPLFEIGPCFRAGELGRYHAPEFTMLEWYRLDEDLEALWVDAAELLAALLGKRLDSPEVRRMDYAETFADLCGFDPLATPELALPAAAALGMRTEDVAVALDYLLTHRVAPAMPAKALWSLHGWPPALADLDAEAQTGGRRWCRRFEIYCGEVELLNACVELREPALLRDRPRVRKEILTPDFRRTLERLPPCAGAALGMDRVWMLAAGAESLAC